jgi:hypothetical protein
MCPKPTVPTPAMPGVVLANRQLTQHTDDKLLQTLPTSSHKCQLYESGTSRVVIPSMPLGTTPAGTDHAQHKPSLYYPQHTGGARLLQHRRLLEQAMVNMNPDRSTPSRRVLLRCWYNTLSTIPSTHTAKRTSMHGTDPHMKQTTNTAGLRAPAPSCAAFLKHTRPVDLMRKQ